MKDPQSEGTNPESADTAKRPVEAQTLRQAQRYLRRKEGLPSSMPEPPLPESIAEAYRLGYAAAIRDLQNHLNDMLWPSTDET